MASNAHYKWLRQLVTQRCNNCGRSAVTYDVATMADATLQQWQMQCSNDGGRNVRARNAATRNVVVRINSQRCNTAVCSTIAHDVTTLLCSDGGIVTCDAMALHYNDGSIAVHNIVVVHCNDGSVTTRDVAALRYNDGDPARRCSTALQRWWHYNSRQCRSNCYFLFF